MSPSRFDAIIVGGGHNGLVAAGYLAGAGLKTLVLEAAPRLGGPLATIEFMPGYFSTVANSPGSLEPRIVRDLELERHGLRFTPLDPTLVHPLYDGSLFVGWRDRGRTAAQLDGYAPGEAARYDAFFAYLQAFAERLGISVFREPPSLHELVRNLTTLDDQEAFGRIFFGSARDLFDEFGLAPQTQAVIAPIAVVGGHFTPSTPGTTLNLLARPLSLASQQEEAGYDPRRMPLRGSTGMPVGGMGAIADAMAASARGRGALLYTASPVARIATDGIAVQGVVTSSGAEYRAPIVIAAINPRTTFVELLDAEGPWAQIREKMGRRRMAGKAFKLVLALDGEPRYAQGDPVEAAALAAAQFRIAPSIDYLEEAHADMMLGRAPAKPVVWGLCPSMSSPGLAPPGRHVMSLNISNAPYHLRDGGWAEQRELLAKRVIAAVAGWMPNLPGLITDYRILDPLDFERQFGFVEANMTHGDLAPWNQFWMRPLPGLHRYRTPVAGLYLSGNGTWPGNFISGLSGHNAAHAVLRDLREQSVKL